MVETFRKGLPLTPIVTWILVGGGLAGGEGAEVITDVTTVELQCVVPSLTIFV